MSEQVNVRTILQEIQPLSDDEMLAAREAARALVLRDIGEEPKPEQFMRRAAASGTPRWLTLIVAGVLGLATIAAFLLSLFRVFTAGRDLFLTHLPNEHIQAALAGVATFMLAELLVVGSVFTAQVYVTGLKRVPLYIAALLGIAMALTANVVVSKPDSWWSWLDTIAPPLAVLLLSLAGEALLLDTLKKRAAAYAEYAAAFEAWKRDTAQPEASLKFHNRYLPRAIKRALIERNSTGAGSQKRREMMQALRPEVWEILVVREIQAMDFYDADRAARALERESASHAPTPLSVQPPRLQPTVNAINGHS
ncbi:MAG: hypothetical protein SF123_02815 [Chloroflexota bacterium]|nr:hypothetical protein [Chloroflexota bacterium]